MLFLVTPAQTVNVPGWVGPVVAISAALIVAISAVLVARTRKPVGITDLWAENRSLRADMDAMDLKFTARIGDVVERYQAVGEGFVVVSDVLEQAHIRPTFTSAQQSKIDAARRAIATDLDWPTITKEKQ